LAFSYIDPLLPGLLLLFVASLVSAWRRMGWPRWILASGCLLFFLATWHPFASLCVWTLEAGYPKESPNPPETDFEAIVVLASGAFGPRPWNPEGTIGLGTYVRCQHAAWLYHNVKAVPIIASGGQFDSEAHPSVYAEVMRKALIEKGVPDEHIWLERESHDTYTNTLYSAKILRQHGIQKVALVTEAYHMLRSEACMRQQGFAVVPAPAGFKTMTTFAWDDLLPRSQALRTMDTVVHEWVGLLWYTASGRI
jgi:uncharacterized SAM-binding protein YcdF (DUF218 family)